MKKGLELLPAGDPELIEKIAEAMAGYDKRIQIRTYIKDEAGNFVDSFVSDVTLVVGDFIDLNVHGEGKSYEVVERRLSVRIFTDTETNVVSHIRSLEITARLLAEPSKFDWAAV